MTKPLVIALFVSSSLMVGCGGGTDPTSAPSGSSTNQPAPAADAPAPAAPIAPVAPPAPVAPAPAAPVARVAPVAPAKPARPAYTRTDLQVGGGREATKGKGLSVNYTGWLYDPSKPDLKGRMFDSSQGRGPFNFVLGARQVIPGWDQGFDGMKIGGRRRLIIPSDMAYGVDGAGGGIIPPDATLVFEMELLDVQQ